MVFVVFCVLGLRGEWSSVRIKYSTMNTETYRSRLLELYSDSIVVVAA
jgi:hypothetical protein